MHKIKTSGKTTYIKSNRFKWNRSDSVCNKILEWKQAVCTTGRKNQ